MIHPSEQDYPTATLDLPDGATGPRVPLLVVLGLVLAGAIGCLPILARRARRRPEAYEGMPWSAPELASP